MIIVGVDPGVNGAVTILNTYKYREVQSLPLSHNTLSDIYLFLSEIRGGSPYETTKRNYATNDISVEPTRAQPVVPIKKSLHRIYGKAPVSPLADDDTYDNTMEMWLEEPGQIVVNSRITYEGKIHNTKGTKKVAQGKGTRDNTGALLAGMASRRKLGRSIGQWEGIATALNISVNLVPPKRWQSLLNCPTKGNKNISKKCAISAFPFLTDRNMKSTITHDIADSLLIALYGYLQYAEEKYIPLSVRKLLLSSKEKKPHKS